MDGTRVRGVLGRTPGLTAKHVHALLKAAGYDIARMCEPQVVADVELPAAARQFLAAPDENLLDTDLSWLALSGARVLLCTEPDYPPLLAEVPGAPPLLFVLGRVEALKAPQIALVGSRSPTPGGRTTAREFAAWFARVGLTVTSGLALGIDTASHEGALLVGGDTIAVFATGLDRIYPAENRNLAMRIRDHGALVSEFPPRTPPLRQNFPRRNRIISGLSIGTLVIEAAKESGSLITARFAADQGREVFAVPGSIHSPVSRGCHELIRQGATLVEEAADVLSELKNFLTKEGLVRSREIVRKPPALDKEYEMLLDALGFEPATIDVLATRTGLPGGVISSMLLILELEGCVAALPGGRYGRINK